MDHTPNPSPVMLRLRHAVQRKGRQSDWPSLSLFPDTDMLAIIARSSSSRLEPGKAYFISSPCRAAENFSEVELAKAEGFLFLTERREHPLTDESLTLPATTTYTRLCENVVASFHSADVLERFRGHIYFQELLYELYRLRKQRKHSAKTAVEHTRTYMDSHYAEELTVDMLAAMAGISPSYYMELFKKIVGTSPIDYLTSVRMDAARKLLDDTRAAANRVAEAVGYKDPYYFSRQFKRVTGLAPSRYARRNSRRIASLHYPMTGQMLALQHIPYAAPLDREFCRFYKQKYELQIPIHLRDPAVDTNMRFNLQALQEAEPDVVIAGNWLPEAHQQALNKIASTLYIPWWEKDWREHLLIVGRFLGEHAQAERWLEKYDALSAKIREKLKDRLGEFSVMAIHVWEGQMYRFGSRNLGTVLYDDLQLRFPGGRADTAYEPIGPDQLLALKPDRLLAAVADDPRSLEAWTNMTVRPEWTESATVRNHRVHRIQPDPWFDYSALGNARILNEIDRLFS